MGWDSKYHGPTCISHAFLGIFSTISASRLSSMAFGVSSSRSLTRRYLIISSLLGHRDTLINRPPRRFSTSARIWVPVMNIRAPGDLSRIWFSEPLILSQYTAAHSSRASMHTNMRCEDVMSCSIFTISVSYGPRPPMAFFCSWKPRDISSGIVSIPLTICSSKEPSMAVADWQQSQSKNT